jgi:hypothetical protein
LQWEVRLAAGQPRSVGKFRHDLSREGALRRERAANIDLPVARPLSDFGATSTKQPTPHHAFLAVRN